MLTSLISALNDFLIELPSEITDSIADIQLDLDKKQIIAIFSNHNQAFVISNDNAICLGYDIKWLNKTFIDQQDAIDAIKQDLEQQTIEVPKINLPDVKQEIIKYDERHVQIHYTNVKTHNSKTAVYIPTLNSFIIHSKCVSVEEFTEYLQQSLATPKFKPAYKTIYWL